jgi:hypothetical protein
MNTRGFMNSRRRGAGLASSALLVVMLVVLAAGLVSAQGPPTHPPGLDRAIAAQEAHTDALLARAGVVGTAVGLGPNGQPVVKIYTRSAGVRGLPAALDGVPVEVEETGDLVAQAQVQGIGESSGTDRLIVSRGSLYCTVGTLGALVRDAGGVVYALSNAHVYANEGSKTYGGPVLTGDSGDLILQPGRVDMQPVACGTENQRAEAVIGRLSAYGSIIFSRTANNKIDAAIAKLSDQDIYDPSATWYGMPSSTITPAAINLLVQKQGRTTGLTQGTVTAINATVVIRYDKGQARFVGQIVVKGNGSSFSEGGDSGSLIVTQTGNNPVALLFAGSSSSTIGNPIQDVLDAFSPPFVLDIVGD